jgi:hypothetical protein
VAAGKMKCTKGGRNYMVMAAQMIRLDEESRCLLLLAIQATALSQLQMQQSTINEGFEYDCPNRLRSRDWEEGQGWA